MIGDFLSQVPGGEFENGSLEGFTNDVPTEQVIAGHGFAEINPH